MWALIIKVTLGTVVAACTVLGLYGWLGYERTELLAFALLIGLSVGALKAHG